MTQPDKAPPRVIDWPAVRVAYETGTEPVRVIADQHGISSSAIDHHMRSEGWHMRRDRARLARGLESSPRGRVVDWDVIRREYENGGFSIEEIRARHGISEGNLYRHRKAGNWPLRRAHSPRAFGAGGAMDTTEKLRALVQSELVKLVTSGRLAENIDLSDPLRALHTLTHALQKMHDFQDRENRRDAGDSDDRLIINDASRLSLARRLAALAEAWETAGGGGSP
jgi:hypothetical protein